MIYKAIFMYTDNCILIEAPLIDINFDELNSEGVAFCTAKK